MRILVLVLLLLNGFGCTLKAATEAGSKGDLSVRQAALEKRQVERAETDARATQTAAEWRARLAAQGAVSSVVVDPVMVNRSIVDALGGIFAKG